MLQLVQCRTAMYGPSQLLPGTRVDSIQASHVVRLLLPASPQGQVSEVQFNIQPNYSKSLTGSRRAWYRCSDKNVKRIA